MKYFRQGAICILLTSLISACGGSRQSGITPEQRAVSGKVKAEAYLFDAVLKRQGKTTSFRLEMFAVDSAIGLAGRGYLGKGALKGVATRDSLKVYFPSTNEFVEDSYSSILSTGDCKSALPEFKPVRLMFVSPDSLQIDSALRVERVSSTEDMSEYKVRTDSCQWTLRLSYRRGVNGWRPSRLAYDDGRGTTLIALRREYKPGARVPASRFIFIRPADAVRIAE